MNRSLWSWVEGEYHQSPHRGLDARTPLDQWALAGHNVRYPDPATDLDDLFLFEAKRRVMKDRTLSLNGRLYEVDAVLVGQTVTLRYDPQAPPSRPIEVVHDGHSVQALPLASTPTPTPAVKRHRPSSQLHLRHLPHREPSPSPLAMRKLKENEVMYLRHFALTRLPFETPAHTDELYESNSRREAEARLHHLIELKGIGLHHRRGRFRQNHRVPTRRRRPASRPVSGGLRLLDHRQRARHVQSPSPGNWGFPPNARAPPPTAPSVPKITRRVCEAKQLPVLVIDEAQHLRNDVLEDIRLLCNFAMDSENRLCLLLVGLTELRRRLAMAVHESLSQRLIVRHHLNGLDRDELDALPHPPPASGRLRTPLVRTLRHRGTVPEHARIASAHQPHCPLRPDRRRARQRARTVTAEHLEHAVAELRL